MASTTFDAIDYFEKLKAAGVPEEQEKNTGQCPHGNSGRKDHNETGFKRA